jgi:hypothetical protein
MTPGTTLGRWELPDQGTTGDEPIRLGSVLRSISVGETLEISIEGHAARTDSREFRAARTTVQKIVATLRPNHYGDSPIQAHHGGSIWIYDGKIWRMVLNWAGIEWSAQLRGLGVDQLMVG